MRMRGFEPPRPYRALDPESSASANSATSAKIDLDRETRPELRRQSQKVIDRGQSTQG